jgi:hypothetical protein
MPLARLPDTVKHDIERKLFFLPPSSELLVRLYWLLVALDALWFVVGCRCSAGALTGCSEEASKWFNVIPQDRGDAAVHDNP